MSELSKQALKVENNMEFPNNNNGQITPSKLRTFNEDMIDSTVNQAVYTSDSASWNAQIIAISASAGGDFTSLNQFTASQDTKNTTLASVTQSLQNQLTNIGSQSGSWDNTSLNAFTQSQETKDSTIATYTASVDQKFSNIGAQSGSWITESETGSFARYDVSNPWSADQTFTNITALSASFTYIKTTYETSSVIYSSGSNQFGDAADDTQTLYGSVKVMNALTASGLNYPTADNGVKSFIQTDGAGNLSLQYVETIFETIRNSEAVSIVKGTPVYISGSTGANGNAYIADASNPSKMPAIYIAGETLAPGAVGQAIVLGLIEGVNTTGYPAGTEVFVAAGGGWTSVRPTGSAIVQSLGIVTKEGNGGQGVVLNPGPANLPNIQQGYVWVGNSNSYPTQVATSSLVTTPTDITALNQFTASQESKNATLGLYTASVDISLTNLNSNTASQQSQIDNLIAATASYSTTSVDITSLNAFTASQSIINQNVSLSASIYETKFDTIGTQSGSWSGGGTDLTSLNAFTASQQELNLTFATTGSNSFNGNQTITGSLLVTGNTFVTPAVASNNLGYPLVFISASTVSKDSVDTLMYNPSTNILSMSGSLGQSAMNVNNLNYTSITASITSTMSKGIISSADATGAPTTFKQISISANPSVTGNPTLATITNPSILTPSSSVGGLIAPIQFQDRSGYTDGRVTFTRPVVLEQPLTASLTEGYVWAGGVGNVSKLVATSSFGGGGGAAFPYTGDASISGSLQVTGSFRGFVNNLSVVVTTASIDMNNGNFFTLNLPTASTTYIEVTNIKAGQTINLQVSQSSASTGSVTFAPNIKFAGGFDYTATAITGALDLVSFVSFDTNQIIATSVKNLL